MDAQPKTNTMNVETPTTEVKPEQQLPEAKVLRLRGGGLCVDCLAYFSPAEES
jgi:hypothetical protein